MKVKVNHLPDVSSALGSSRLNKNSKKKYVQKKKVRVKLMAWHLTRSDLFLCFLRLVKAMQRGQGDEVG